MKKLIPVVFAMLFVPVLAQDKEGAKEDAAAPELESIFNGENLDGWKAPADNIWWLVENGELLVKSGPDKKGSILSTEREFEDFRVELEFKFGEGTIDSGVFIRNNKEQIQIGISGSLKRDMTASPYIPGKGYPVEATGVKELLRPDDWNQLAITAVGPVYTTWLNGEQVMTYTSDSAAEKGPIGIQLHAKRDMSIRYRNIKAGDL